LEEIFKQTEHEKYETIQQVLVLEFSTDRSRRVCGTQQAKDMEVGPEEIKAVLLLTAGCSNVGGMHPSLMH